MVNGIPGWGGYYLSAYGLAVKHGYVGTEEEWLESLKGAGVQLRYDAGHLYWKRDDEDEWQDIEDFFAAQSEISENVSKAITGLQESARKTEEELRTNAETLGATLEAAAQAAHEAAEDASAAKEDILSVKEGVLAAKEDVLTAAEDSETRTSAAIASLEEPKNSATAAAEAANDAAESANMAGAELKEKYEEFTGLFGSAENIESLVNHVSNNFLHLTSSEKKFVQNGVYVAYYTGTGAETLKLLYDNGITMPRLVIIMPQASAPVTITDGKLSIYFALGCYKYGGTKGLTVEQKTFSLKQDPENGCCLNEKGKRYAIIMIP